MSILMGLAVAFLGWCTCRPEMAVKMPRWKVAGALLGTLVLAWCGYEGLLLLEGNLARFRPLIVALVPASVAIAWFCLDYLWARALGGAMVLVANMLLHLAFVEDCCWRPLYSLIVFFWGAVGTVMVGWPWQLRMAYEWLARHDVLAKATVCLVGISVVAMLLLPLI